MYKELRGLGMSTDTTLTSFTVDEYNKFLIVPAITSSVVATPH